jgi:hypothetical protein
VGTERREVKAVLSAEVPRDSISAIDKLTAALDRAAKAQESLGRGGRSGWNLPGGGFALPGGSGITYGGGYTAAGYGKLGSAVGGYVAPPTPAPPAAPLITNPLGGGTKAAGPMAGLAGKAMAGLRAYAGPAALAALPLGVLHAGATTTAIFHDQYTTGEQKARQLIRAVPGGERLLGITDDLRGVTAAMERVGEARSQDASRLSIHGQETSFLQSFNPAQAGRAETARQYATGSAVGENYVNRSAVGGELAFRNESRLLGVRKEIQKADREAAATGRERAAAAAELVKATAKELEFTKRRDDLNRQVDRLGGSGPERADLLRRADAANNEAIQATGQRQTAAANLQGATTAAAGATAGAAKARAGLLGAKAAGLEDAADANAGAAARFGGMNLGQRGLAKIGLDMLRRSGRDGVPDELYQAAASAYPDAVREITQKSAEANPAYRQFQADNGLTPGARVEDLRQQAAGVRNEQASAEYAADAKFSQAAKDAGEKLAEINARAFQDLIRAYDVKIRNDILAAKATI